MIQVWFSALLNISPKHADQRLFPMFSVSKPLWFKKIYVAFGHDYVTPVIFYMSTELNGLSAQFGAMLGQHA